MAIPLSESNETGSTFASRQAAEGWHRGKDHRAEATGLANELMLELATLRAGDKVLDVAAGTGDQTLMATRRVGPTGYVLATNISASMLDIASELEPSRVSGTWQSSGQSA